MLKVIQKTPLQCNGLLFVTVLVTQKIDLHLQELYLRDIWILLEPAWRSEKEDFFLTQRLSWWRHSIPQLAISRHSCAIFPRSSRRRWEASYQIRRTCTHFQERMWDVARAAEDNRIKNCTSSCLVINDSLADQSWLDCQQQLRSRSSKHWFPFLREEAATWTHICNINRERLIR